MQPFLGMLMAVPYTFPPKGWVFCDGQILAIAQNQALFSLLGTTYGGNGQTTFALPDLRGKSALSSGNGMALGQVGGLENVTLQPNQLPTHGHTVGAAAVSGSIANPSTNVLAQSAMYKNAPPDPAAQLMNPGAVTPAGGNQAHNNRAPYLVVNWCIALVGIFPSRN